MSPPSEQPSKLRIGVVGLGKMGLSHFSIVNAHPLTETVICDASKYMLETIGRYTSNPIYTCLLYTSDAADE